MPLNVDNYIANGKIENGKKLMRKLDCENDKIILIGDTDHDYRVAQNLKIDCLLISHGHQSNRRLKDVSQNLLLNVFLNLVLDLLLNVLLKMLLIVIIVIIVVIILFHCIFSICTLCLNLNFFF